MRKAKSPLLMWLHIFILQPLVQGTLERDGHSELPQIEARLLAFEFLLGRVVIFAYIGPFGQSNQFPLTGELILYQQPKFVAGRGGESALERGLNRILTLFSAGNMCVEDDKSFTDK